jgi:hypothetical protein
MAMRCWIVECAGELELVLAALVLSPLPFAACRFFLHVDGHM